MNAKYIKERDRGKKISGDVAQCGVKSGVGVTVKDSTCDEDFGIGEASPAIYTGIALKLADVEKIHTVCHYSRWRVSLFRGSCTRA